MMANRATRADGPVAVERFPLGADRRIDRPAVVSGALRRRPLRKICTHPSPSWPGLSWLFPAIHVLLETLKKDVDARHKAGHDDAEGLALTHPRLALRPSRKTWMP